MSQHSDLRRLRGCEVERFNDPRWSVGQANRSQCDDTCLDFQFAEVEHWDGSGWQRVDGPPTYYGFSGLRNLTVQSAQRIWVVGHQATDPIVSLWDGTRWNSVPSGMADETLWRTRRATVYKGADPGPPNWKPQSKTGFEVNRPRELVNSRLEIEV